MEKVKRYLEANKAEIMSLKKFKTLEEFQFWINSACEDELTKMAWLLLL